MIKERPRILITGTGGRSVGAGILHALLRTAPEVAERWHVSAADADPFAWGLYVAHERYLLPFASSPDYINAIVQLVEEQSFAAVLPGTEAEAVTLASNRDRVPVPVIANRDSLMPIMMDKFKLQERLRALELPVIATVPAADWRKLLEAYDFPFIVKPTRGTGGSRALHLVVTQQEMERLLPELDPATYPCAQPYLGTADDEYTVGVLTDFDGKLIDSIVMRRKLTGLSLLASRRVEGRTLSVSTGYSQGFIVRDDSVQGFCEKMALDLGSRGPLNVQLRVVDGTPHVFEVHPRFSGTTPIRASVGFNEPDLLLRNVLLGQSFGRQPYTDNVAAIRAFEHVIVPVSDMADSRF